jgi:branched-chain amino acid transport system substrate-binding protein
MTRYGGGFATAIVASVVATLMGPANAQKKYDAGATDTEIKIGTIMPFTGRASAYAVVGKAIAAYFKKINGEGGVNGRQINLVSYDDAYNPAKTVEQAHRLVEDDQVLLIFASLGTQTNAAIRGYLNSQQVPQLFVASGASRWDNPKDYPWTMGFQPSYQMEAHIYAQYLLENHARGKIAILYQNDDFGKDYLSGLQEAWAARCRSSPRSPTSSPTQASIRKSPGLGALARISCSTSRRRSSRSRRFAAWRKWLGGRSTS